MPGNPKQKRIRVRVIDEKPRTTKDMNKIKGGMSFIDFVDSGDGREFIVCAATDKQLGDFREKLSSLGFKEIEGDTTVPARSPVQTRGAGSGDRGGRGFVGRGQGSREGARAGAGDDRAGHAANPAPVTAPLSKKPYGFVSLPESMCTSPPVWHDGTSSQGRSSGEIRFELETLTPMLVGWERGTVGARDEDWPVPSLIPAGPVGGNPLRLPEGKPVLCPLRAPWGDGPVIIPGNSLKGLLRHELGALLGAPMERVAERSYSYRPNARFPDRGARLVPRLALVPMKGFVEEQLPDSGQKVRVPIELELLPTNLEYSRHGTPAGNYYKFDEAGGHRYLGGMGAGKALGGRRPHHTVGTSRCEKEKVQVTKEAQKAYLLTLEHLLDTEHGHFSSRHPAAPPGAVSRILDAAQRDVFQPGDVIWVEWDLDKKKIVSFGWHYYYRWAYTDSVRRRGLDRLERKGLFPIDAERDLDEHGAPRGLSAVRRLFGYTGGDDARGEEGTSGIGRGDHAQLMGRISVNAALEVLGAGESEQVRFLPPTFLRELGMPRPSAVEHYLRQRYHPRPRPGDGASLETYGDAVGYDAPGEIAGRKFYLDRSDARQEQPWRVDEQTDGFERRTLAMQASRPGRRYRFTVRFRDLDDGELAAILVAFSPDQFKEVLGGRHADGYCSKLGFARPLGWGSVRIEARGLFLLNSGEASLEEVTDLPAWVGTKWAGTDRAREWLEVHRCKHPDAGDYPASNGKIYTYHTNLRSDHSKRRRDRRGA